MTEEQLKAIAARARDARERADSLYGGLVARATSGAEAERHRQQMRADLYWSDMASALVAEVRELRGLLKRCEWASNALGAGDSCCPLCRGTEHSGGDRHAPDCALDVAIR